ncbi:MAG: WecB/TagA/CpsF family glycosyltransferase [Armatimonadota bacterium]|nr:WecB/TagA/CpsF family glycosyltransferase [Armatimonadota bacterium]
MARRHVGICALRAAFDRMSCVDGQLSSDRLPVVTLAGVAVHCVDMPTAVAIILDFVKSDKPHMVVTADSSMVVLAQKDPELRKAISEADLVTPDSFGILLGARLVGKPIKERVSGADLSVEICRIAAREGFPVYLLGGEPGVADQAAARLKEQFPELVIAGTHHGYFGADLEPEIVRAIRSSGAKILLVGMGIPRQEKFIHQHLNELGTCTAMGVGGTLDVLSGRVKRAPMWMQRHGLEWLYRLIQNPRKISKVATLPKFLFLVLSEKVKRCWSNK